MKRNASSVFRTAAAGFVLAALLAAGAACRESRTADPASRTLRIAVVPMGTTHEFWKAIHAGAAAAARELGAEIIWKGPLKEDDRNEQIQIVETLTNAGIDALVLTPMDNKALVRPVAEAKRAGIPVVIYNSALDGTDYVAYISTDNYQGGVVAARRVGALLNGTGKVILIRVIASVEGSTKRENGFLATVKAEFPGLQVLSDNQYAGVTTETAYQTAENLLNRYPDVQAVFTANESSTFGCLRALQDHGLAGKVLQVGFDSSKKLIEALAGGQLAGLVLQDPFRMGYVSLSTAVAHVRGRPYEKVVDTGVFLATPENRNDPLIRRLLSPDLSILER